MKGNETDSNLQTAQLHYAIRLTFGLVNAVLLTLITFGLIVWIPSFSHWSFALLGCLVLPIVSICLTGICTGSVQYVCEGQIHIQTLLQSCWIPPLGIFCISLFILPLELRNIRAFGPLNILIATSIIMNAIITCILQVYTSTRVEAKAKSLDQSSNSTEFLLPNPTGSASSPT